MVSAVHGYLDTVGVDYSCVAIVIAGGGRALSFSADPPEVTDPMLKAVSEGADGQRDFS